LAQELIDLRQIFLSQYVHRTYNSYVLSQFKKLDFMFKTGQRFFIILSSLFFGLTV